MDEPCGATVAGEIDIGCDVVPVEPGQIVRVLRSRRGLRCGFRVVGDVLVIHSDRAVLRVIAEDASGNVGGCELDLTSPPADDD